MKKYQLLLIILLAFSKSLYAADGEYTLEELNAFLEEGVITKEEYQILKNEISDVKFLDEIFLYEMEINDSIKTKNYKVIRKNGVLYYPLLDFLSVIDLRNYEVENNNFKFLLGENLMRANLDCSNNTYVVDNKNYKYNKGEVYKEKGEVYISEEIFKNLFTKSLEKNENLYKIDVSLTFKTPREIATLLENRSLRFGDKKDKNNLFFSNKKGFFDLGYLKFDLKLEYDNQKDKKIERSGEIEYQGGLLFGELTTSYDLKDNEIGDVTLYYPNYLKGHSLEVGSYGSGASGRELGFSLKKEKGYFEEDGEIIIREKVPLGSKVELLYLGYPIDIADEENGEVEFRNSEIRSDRNYELKVYSPDGKISIIRIDTSTDYNKQEKGSFEYDISGQEDDKSDEFLLDGMIYYGLTENLTIGLGYEKEIEDEGIYEYGIGELIYSSNYKDIEYTFTTENKFSSDERDSMTLESDISYKDLRFKSETSFYEKGYREKEEHEYSIEYQITNEFEIDYTYYIDKNWYEEEVHNYEVGISMDKEYRDLLVTGEWSMDRNHNQEYELNFYYTGFNRLDVKFNNRWQTAEDNYEGSLEFNKKQPVVGLDYGLEVNYSNNQETRFGLTFTLELDNWLDFEFTREGRRNYGSVGIERVVDLKKPMKKIDSMDVSRVKFMTYLDKNNNNKYEKGEEMVPYSKITVGKEEVRTDENGIAWMYGVSNDVIYDIETLIRRPSQSIGENILKLQGVRAGTIEAFIPVKTKVNFRGQINLNSNFDEDKVRDIYNDMSVRIRNSDGEHLETLVIEEDGSFILSDIYPGEYEAEVSYWGEEYKVSKETLKANVTYQEGEDEIFELNFDLKK